MHTRILLLLILTFCYSALAVHWCYQYDGPIEKFDETEINATRCLQNPALCESRQETPGNVKKGCIENSPDAISECDALNRNKGSTSCYHCDREKCNSAEISSASLVLASVTGLFVFRFV